MDGFDEGTASYMKYAAGANVAQTDGAYVTGIQEEIENLTHNMNGMKGFATSSSKLEGDAAEYWHTATFISMPPCAAV